jgi:hypothetical protein
MTIILIILAIICAASKLWAIAGFFFLAAMGLAFIQIAGPDDEETCEWYETKVNGGNVPAKVNSTGKVVKMEIYTSQGERIYQYDRGLVFNHAPAKVVNDALNALDRLNLFDSKVYIKE